MTTIHDVAAEANVSVSTVSHVLNGTRFVAPATAQRVLDAIRTLNYRPNLVARSLRRHKTDTIGLIVPDNSNPFFAEIARVIEDRGFAKNYAVILCNSDGSPDKEAVYIDALVSKQVDGIILIPSAERSEAFDFLRAYDLPMIIVDRELGNFPVDQITTDNEAGGYLAGKYLLELGHRVIGYISGPDRVPPSHNRLLGLRRALAEIGADLDDRAIAHGDFQYLGGVSAMRDLLQKCPDITAVFAANDLMAIGAIKELRRTQRRVPEDVSVIGYDGIVAASMMWPPITTVAQPIVKMGEVSVSMLLERMENSEVPPRRIVIPPTLVVRESCQAVDHKTDSVAERNKPWSTGV